MLTVLELPNTFFLSFYIMSTLFYRVEVENKAFMPLLCLSKDFDKFCCLINNCPEL